MKKEPTTPYIMKLGDGRSLFVALDPHMVEYDGGEMFFTPAGVKHLDKIRVLAMRQPKAVSPGYLKTLRDALHLTQDEFAGQIGVSIESVKKWEGGSRRPGPRVLRKIQGLADSSARRGVALVG